RNRRWHFVIETGTIHAEPLTAIGGTLHTGPNTWLPAPPTITTATGLSRPTFLGQLLSRYNS
ncbi:hypothetical protein ACW4YW_15610, partial [Methylobacillus pratensis]